jgi:hypothetical protein
MEAHYDNFWGNLRTGLISFGLSISAPLVYAQIVITSPLHNQVLQRSQQDSATISVTGYIHQPYKNFSVSLTPLVPGKSSSQIFFPDQEQLDQGFFSLIIKAKTGWYNMRAEGTTLEENIDSISVGRVGIGEVFLVAGNSNAMGLPKLGAKDPKGAVISFNAVNKFLNSEDITVAPNEPMPLPAFSPMKSAGFLFPSGETSWYWGEFGDLLHDRLQVPVLILNAAWAAANSENYRDAASGKNSYNMYVGKNWPNLQPYSNIVNTLKYFNSWLGIRGILWSHGENDAVHLQITQENYFNNIQYLIRRTREDIGQNVPWLIARNSASNASAKPYLPVVNAQTALTKIPKFNVWPGPDMDTIQIPRPSHGHFENVAGGIQGLSEAAKAWNRGLSDSLLKRITPLQPENFIHTGVAPVAAHPGAAFDLPYRIDGTVHGSLTVQAELLDSKGRFVAIAGSGKKSPVKVKIPGSLPDGPYRLRIVSQNPILPGSASEQIQVAGSHEKIIFSHPFTTTVKSQEIRLSWLVSAVTNLDNMVLQKSFNHDSYTDAGVLPAVKNASASHLYTATESYSDEETVFYRIKFNYLDGTNSYSSAVVVFGKNAPPKFIAFPNPVSGQGFYVRSDATKDFTCTLYDVHGWNHALAIPESDIQGLTLLRTIFPLVPGIYILHVEQAGVVSKQKLIFR